MPKTTALVPLTHPETGEPVAAGAEISLSDDNYAVLRSSGSVSASEKEQKAGQQTAGPEGVYNARTTREDAGQPEEDAPKTRAKDKD